MQASSLQKSPTPLTRRWMSASKSRTCCYCGQASRQPSNFRVIPAAPSAEKWMSSVRVVKHPATTAFSLLEWTFQTPTVYSVRGCRERPRFLLVGAPPDTFFSVVLRCGYGPRLGHGLGFRGNNVKQVAVISISALVLSLAGCQNSATPVSAATPVPSKTSPAIPATTPAQEDGFVASGPIVVENQIDLAAQREGIIAELD